MSLRTAALAPSLALALTLAGCSGASTETASDPAASRPPADASAPGGTTYTVADYTFPALSVSPGETIRLIDRDGEPHSVTADDTSFDSGLFDDSTPGSLVAPTAPGSYPFHCTVHPSMKGVLVVG